MAAVADADTAAPAAKPAAAPSKHHMHHGHKAAAAAGATMAPAATGSWVLKSATPGKAWIAEPGSAEIRTVAVGESIKGLGKITAISQDSGGHWIVAGTKGQINQ
jgi:hypothetical protein